MIMRASIRLLQLLIYVYIKSVHGMSFCVLSRIFLARIVGATVNKEEGAVKIL